MKNIKTHLYLYLLGLALAGGCFALDLSWELGVAGGVLYIIPIIPGLVTHNRRFIIVAALAGTVLTIAGYFLSPFGGELWKISINRFLALFAIWLTAGLGFYHLQKENKLRLSNNLLDAISHAQSQFIQETNSTLFFEELLRRTLALTQSQYGFIAELVHGSNGKPYLKSLATTNLPWEDETDGIYTKFLKTGLELHNMDSLYGSVISSGKPVISNEPSTDLRRGGLPPGHPPLKSFLGLPFIFNKELFGMVCLANRPVGYDKNLVEYLQPFVGTCENLVRAHQIEKKRQLAEKKLRETETQLYRVIRNAPVPLVIHSKDGQIHMVNKMWTKLTGYRQSDIPTIQQWAEKACGKQKHRALTEIQKLYSIDKFPLDGNFTITTSSGKTQVLDFRSSPLGKLPNGMNFVISMAQDITDRESEKHQLEASLEQLRNLSNRLQTIREEERKHIAREVHDEIGQTLTSLKYDFNWIESQLSPPQEPLREKIKSMENLVNNLMQTVQKIASDLHPMVLDDLGLCEAIKWQVREFQHKTGIQCELNLESHPIDINLDAAPSTMVFRVIQEALTNVARHANASKISIHFYQDQKQIGLTITDDGEGITQAQVYNEKSMGLLGIRERARLWGGEVHISGESGQGTTVKLIAPLKFHDDSRNL